MLGQIVVLKFGWMKGAKSARSFFIRPPLLCNKVKLEYLKIDYTSIQTPDKMAYNGKPLSGRFAASNKQSSYFKLRLLTKSYTIFSVSALLFFQEEQFTKKSNKYKWKILHKLVELF